MSSSRTSKYLIMAVKICVILPVLMILLEQSRSFGAILTLRASVDGNIGDANGDGTFESLNSANLSTQGLIVRKVSGLLADRCVMEFDLARIPSAAVVDQWTLKLRQTSFTSSSRLVVIHAYLGDGFITLADGTRATAALTSYDPVANGNGPVSVLLPGPFLSDYIGTNRWLGVRLEAGEGMAVNTSLSALEQNASDGSPILQISYHLIPEPSSLGLVLTLGIYALRRSR